MAHYKSNLRDIEFNLFEVFGTADRLAKGPFAELDGDTVRSILSEVDRFVREDLAVPFADADRNPPVFDPKTHSVTMPESVYVPGGKTSVRLTISAPPAIPRATRVPGLKWM